MIIERRQIEAILPQYVIGETLGQGGYGIVLAGHHRQLRRDVAIKIIGGEPSRPELRESLVAEARILAQLDHPHIVRIYDFVGYREQWLIIMQRLPGGDLGARHRAGLPPADACAVSIAIAEALEYVHSAHIIHRDIKPANVLFDANNRPKVTDFGIAKIFSDSRAVASRGVGTPTYMAPEQFSAGRPLGPQTDIYALGVLTYELLSGQPPFARSGGPAELMRRHLDEIPKRPENIPPALADPILWALEKNILDRPRSARQFAMALAGGAAAALGTNWLETSRIDITVDGEIRAAAAGLPVGSRNSASAKKSRRARRGVRRRTRRVLVSLTVSASVLAAALGVLYATGNSTGSENGCASPGTSVPVTPKLVTDKPNSVEYSRDASGVSRLAFEELTWAGIFSSIPSNACAYQVDLDARVVRPIATFARAGWGYGIGTCDRWVGDHPEGFTVQYAFYQDDQNRIVANSAKYAMPLVNDGKTVPIESDYNWHHWTIIVRNGVARVSLDWETPITEDNLTGTDGVLPRDCLDSGLFLRIFNAEAEFKDFRVTVI